MQPEEKSKFLQEIRQLCLFNSIHIGELMMWASNKIVEKEEGLTPAGTDGKTIYFFPPFFQRPIGEACFILMHELMHIAFRHQQRAKSYCSHRIDRLLWNWAADVLINESLMTTWLSTHAPKEGLSFSALASHMPDVYKNLPPDRSTLTTESLYDLMKIHTPADQIETLIVEFGDEDLMSNEEAEEADKQTSSQTGEDRQNLPEELEAKFMSDLIERMKTYGDQAYNALFKFKGELPKVKTPWNKYLVNFLRKHMIKGYRSNWTKPSRTSLSGVVPCFLPASQKEISYKPLVIAVDLSGSCWSQSVQAEFYANIIRIQQLYRCPIVLVTFDVRIHNVYEFEAGNNTFKKVLYGLTFNGGGGTSFVDLFNPIWVDDNEKEWPIEPECMVVLTDLYGSFPEKKPKFPVLWAILKEGADKAPFGKVVELFL